jgi:hypothetical protein
MNINPAKKMNTYGQGKYLLRKAFEGMGYLPDSILYREKAAFSDAVGHSLVDYIKEYAEETYSDEDLANAKEKYAYRTPYTKESLLRKFFIFFIFIAFILSTIFLSNMVNRIFLAYIIYLSAYYDNDFSNIKKQHAIFYSCTIIFLSIASHTVNLLYF